MTNKGAPAPACAIRRRRHAFERMHPLPTRWRIVAVKTTHVAKIACLLLGDRLFMRKRVIDLRYDLLCIFEGEPVSFRPADRLGVREGRPSIIRAVHIIPDAHGALPEIRGHDAGIELLHFIRMAGRFSAGLGGNGRVVAERIQIAVMIEKRADVVVQLAVSEAGKHVPLPVVA